MINGRKVKRVLVMLEYEDGDPNNGEVFDLTQLVTEMHQKSNGYSADIRLNVNSRRDWTVDGYKFYCEIEWQSFSPTMTGHSGHLADVVNASMPDGPRVENLRRKVNRLRKKADQVAYEANQAKIEQVAEIRAQHPIARVTEIPVLAEIAELSN